MLPGRAVAVLLAGLLAGCSGGSPDAAQPPGTLRVEGWVLDVALNPVPGASVVVQGHAANATTDDAGHFLLEAPTGLDLVVTVGAPGFLPQSRAVASGAGVHAWVNVTLERMPFAQPYRLTSSFRGLIECAVTATVVEDPSRPHEHGSAQCSTAVGAARATWNYTIPAGVGGLVLEAFWDPSTPLATALIVKATVAATGETLTFVESTSPLRAQLSQVAVLQALAAGNDRLTIQVTPGAGTGQHDHGAVGVFVQQGFELFMTEFHNGPADPAFTVAAPA